MISTRYEIVQNAFRDHRITKKTLNMTMNVLSHPVDSINTKNKSVINRLNIQKKELEKTQLCVLLCDYAAQIKS